MLFRSLKIRVVNVVDLMKLVSSDSHPHGLTDAEYDTLFTLDKPIIFAFHGYANLIHELTYKRHNVNMHVRGYQEEGAITTSFDMRVINGIDRYNLALLTLKHLSIKTIETMKLQEYCEEMLEKHKSYIKEYGVDMPEVTEFKFEKIGDIK